MYYLDRELADYQDARDAECDKCGGCFIEEYYSCTCSEEEDEEEE